jgi:outer membrane protein OmpA-like peptidoglycan-associated protein
VFNEFAQALKNERGVVITSADDSHGQYKISGFLDPLARNPLDLLKSMDSDELNIVFHWEPYQSMDPYLTLERMKKALKPENTILMRVEDGCIVVSGAATHRWIGEFRQWSRLASGFPCWKENNLVDLDVVKLDNLKSKIESQKIFFRDNVYNPSKEQLESVDQVADNIKEAVRVAKTSGIPLHIIVSGHADQAGSEETNLRISRSRADTLVDLLKAKGIPSTQLSLEAEGSAQRISSADTEQGRALNRRVSFQVLINDDVKHD